MADGKYVYFVRSRDSIDNPIIFYNDFSNGFKITFWNYST